MKGVKLFFLCLFLALIGGGLINFFFLPPSAQIPYPYKFKGDDDNNPDGIALLSSQEAAELKNSQVLVVGDRMGKNLARYEKPLSQLLIALMRLKNPLKFSFLAYEHEGIHRTLNRIRELKKLPSITIFHGGSEEFYEKKFFVQEADKILKNFTLFRDDRVKTLLLGAPILSKIVFSKIRRVSLPIGAINKDKTEYDANIKQQQMDISYQLFEIELEELIQIVQSKNSHMILLTTPLNLEVLPNKVCKNSTSNEIIALQNRIFDLLQKGDFKTAYSEISLLKDLTPGNALTFFLLGQTLHYLGKLEEARPQLEMATALDCTNWRANAIHNTIIRKLAKKYDVPLFDFDDFVNMNFGHNVLFLDEIYPQDFYYQGALKILAAKIKKFLDL